MRLLSCPVSFMLLALVPGASSAAPVTYSWTGTVTSSTGDPPIGATVPVSVTLDRSYPADAKAPDSKRDATYSGGLGTPSGKSPILSVTINGANALGLFDTVHIERNLGGVSRISIQSSLPQCCRSVSIVFSTTIKGVVTSVAIPKTLIPSNFQSATFAVTYTQDDVYGGSLQ